MNGSDLFRLSARAPDECTRIELLDGNLCPIDLARSLGEVNLQLPAGVYAVRFCRGPQFTEKLALLSPATPHVDISPPESDMPQFASAAPLDQTTTTRDWQSGPARDLSLSPPLPPPTGHRGGSHLLLFLRDPFSEYGPNGASLLPEVSLHDYAGHCVFVLSTAARNELEHWHGAHLNLDPGCYRLRCAREGRQPSEQILFTCAGWQTQVFLLAAEALDEPSYVSRCSILMSRARVGFDPRREDLRWTETALRALRHRSNIGAALRTGMLNQTLGNPMLGVCTALLHLRRRTVDLALVRASFLALHQLVGPLPDVLAIGLALARRDPTTLTDPEVEPLLENSFALAHPPMLRESWNHILHATADTPHLIPRGTLADNLAGLIVKHGPWLTWHVESPDRPAAGPAVSSDAAVDDVSTFPMPTSDALLLHRMRMAQNQIAQAFDRRPIDHRSIGTFAEQTALFTLHGGLPLLSRWLAESPETADELASLRFCEMERRVAFWLQPCLDLRIPRPVVEDPFIKDELAAMQDVRAMDPVRLLTDLGLTASSAVKYAWSVYTKLFVKPIVPRRPHLDAYVNQLVGTQPEMRSRLDTRAAQPSLIRHRRSGRALSLLEVTYLIHLGSPSHMRVDGLVDYETLASGLGDAGYVLASEDRPITSTDLLMMKQELMPTILLEQ